MITHDKDSGEGEGPGGKPSLIFCVGRRKSPPHTLWMFPYDFDLSQMRNTVLVDLVMQKQIAAYAAL